MFTKGRKKDTIRFVYHPTETVKKVFVAGDFSDWEPLRLKKQKNGTYALTIDLAKGSYQYKFQVDDNWLLDPDNTASAVNPFGTLNSLAIIE